MILRVDALSPEQKSVIEQILGRQILEAEAISLRAFEPPPVDIEEKRSAAAKLRRLLGDTDASRGVSDEKFEDAFLEAIRSERPHYMPAP